MVGSILTTILTWPFLANLTSFYSDIGDYPQNGYTLWYNQFSLVTGRILNPSEYFNSFQFYPWPYSLAYSELLLIPSLIFSPIYWISQELPFSLNFYVFLSFVLSFISSFYCLNYFTKNERVPYLASKFAAFLGSLVYTFNPLTLAHFPNHLQFMSKYFLLPLLLYGYLFFKKPETKNALFFFLFFTLNALTSFNLMFFSNFALAIYLIFFFFLNLYKRNYIYFLNILKKSLLFIIFIPLLAYFYLPYFNFVQKEKATFDLQLLWLYSATLKDWVSPLPNNFLYKNLLPTNRTEKIPGWGYADVSEEHTLFINIVPLVLAILGLVFLSRSKDRLLLSVSLLTLMVSVVLSFGPHLGNIKLPFYYLMHWLPIFKGTRVPSRFQFIFYIPFSILVSFGFLIIYKAKRRFLIPIFISLTVLLIVENLNHFKFDSTSKVLREKQFIEHNFSFLNGKSTLHFPFGYLGEEASYLTFGTVTQEKMINGYSSYMPPDWFEFMDPFKKSLEEDDLKKLKIIGIQYIIIHKDLLSKQQAQNLSQNQTTLKKGTIFDKSGIQIISLDNFDFDFKLCSIEEDLDFILERFSSFSANYYKLNIESKSDCYLTNTLQNRYLSQVVYDEGTAKTARIRMPIIVAPFEKISVDEIKRNLKIGD